MSTAVWPPVSSEALVAAEKASQAQELDWLLSSLQESLRSLKAGLQECADLLAPREQGSTLVLSTLRSESLKGFVTRVGTRIVKGDIKLRLPSLPPPRGSITHDLTISAAPQAPVLALKQMTDARTSINNALDIVDISTWTGDAKNANFIAGQLRLLKSNLEEARSTLRGGPDVLTPWWDAHVDENIFDPPLPPNVSFYLTINEAALCLEIRTLEPCDSTTAEFHSGFNIRDRLAYALGTHRGPAHDEVDETFIYKEHDVRVKDKIRVESQDPSLISVVAKLNALEHSVALSQLALDTLIEGEGEE